MKKLICPYCGGTIVWCILEPPDCPCCLARLTDEDYDNATRCTGDDCEYAWFNPVFLASTAGAGEYK